MTAYIIRRLLLTLIVIFIVSILIFVAMRLLPGDPILLVMNASQAAEYSEEEMQILRAEYGLDKPMIIQYFNWIGGLFHGDMGVSILSRSSVVSEILNRAPITLHLGLLAWIIGVIIGVPFGVICAVRRGRLIDNIVTALANLGITIPVFWLGLLMMYLFGLYLGWLPVMGYTSPVDNFLESTKRIIMPVFCLSLGVLASMTRQTRSSMLEVLMQDYIRTAWSKGLRERVVIIRHALKNGLIPVITLAGISLSHIIGGSVLIETVFNIPGMGRLAVTSVLNHDYPVTQGIILLVATTVSLVNLLTDLTYGWMDPRIAYS